MKQKHRSSKIFQRLGVLKRLELVVITKTKRPGNDLQQFSCFNKFPRKTEREKIRDKSENKRKNDRENKRKNERKNKRDIE